MINLTIDHVKTNGWLILEVIAGSKAYGLDTPASDTDIRGVFILPKHLFYGLEYTAQVNNETNDIVYYELRRFMELLARNNPNILEILYTPKSCLLYQHEVMKLLNPAIFLSRLCLQTFANYAYTQVKKAYGLEKKIVNPVSEERKSVSDFCYVYEDRQAIPLTEYMVKNKFEFQKIGLTVIDHVKDAYNLYYSEDLPYSGLTKKEASNEVCLSSVPREEKPLALLYFNKDGYSTYCKKYKEYWDWVEKRNEVRFNTTIAHGKKYDAKNMMHVFRLLRMAKEIAIECKVNVFRTDRDFLLSVKEGRFGYDELLEQAEIVRNELPALYQQSDLQDEPDIVSINNLLIEMRERYYQETFLS